MGVSVNSTCCICGLTFEARNSYGVCGKCYSSDRLRAFDKVESATRQARRNGIFPVLLTVPEWLSILSDFAGSCALCRKATATKILRFDRTKGLTYGNVVPSCASCEEHHINGFDTAQERVRLYLDPARTREFIPQDEQKYKDEVVVHPEYH
jgi:hypothetical protein